MTLPLSPNSRNLPAARLSSLLHPTLGVGHFLAVTLFSAKKPTPTKIRTSAVIKIV